MIKTCTNSRCRRPFNTALDAYDGRCPHCGRAYPRLPKDPPCSLAASLKPFFSVFLQSYGQEKIKTIRVIRRFFSVGVVGLAQAKQRVERAPASLGLPLTYKQAVSLAEELQALGCICSVQWVGRPRRIGSGNGPIPLESTPLAPYSAGGDY